MTAKDLLEVEISPLQHTDKGEIALRWMDEFKVSHLPVLKNDNFVGLISESDILDRMDLDQTLDVLFDHLPRPYVFEDAHIYEILHKISEHKISVVPILTKEEKYVGCTTVHQVVAMIGNTGGIKEHGAILVLEVNQIDYSLAQIAQIVESNNAKILSSYIMSSPDSTKLEVTLKINKTELDPIIRTFERYDYTISASFQKSDFNDDLQLRYDSLINYLKL
jgi:predicted transcriptional regulator